MSLMDEARKKAAEARRIIVNNISEADTPKEDVVQSRTDEKVTVEDIWGSEDDSTEPDYEEPVREETIPLNPREKGKYLSKYEEPKSEYRSSVVSPEKRIMVEPTPEEIERARNDAAWLNPNTGEGLVGVLATEPKLLAKNKIRKGFSRWMHSFTSGVPFSIHRSGTSFLFSRDDVEDWRTNVVIYGPIYGGDVHKGDKLKVWGRRDIESGDIIAVEIEKCSEDTPVSQRVDFRKPMNANSVRFLTVVLLIMLVFLLYELMLLVFGAASAVVMFFKLLIRFIELNWIWILLIIFGFNWFRRRLRRWFR